MISSGQCRMHPAFSVIKQLALTADQALTGQTLPFLISDAVILCGQQGEEGEKWRQVYASVDAFICASVQRSNVPNPTHL